MAITPNHSRRAVMMGALAGAAGLLAERLGRPELAKAAPTAMNTESFNTSSAETSITNYGTGAAFGGLATADGDGIWGATNAAAPYAGINGNAYAEAGIGVHARNSFNSGTALKVEGKAAFNRSGKASVPKNKAAVDITVPGGLTTNSLIFANLTVYRAGVAVAAVRPNYPVAGKARIYLTKSVTAATPVAWFVAEHTA
jgi:hypothetical protein